VNRALAIVFVAACSHERTVTLADLQDGTLDVTVSNDGTVVRVRLTDHWMKGDAPCSVIEDRVTATLDGDLLPVTSRGAFIPPPATDAASSCTEPTFETTTTTNPTASSAIEITDGTTTITAVVASLRAVRGFTQVDVLRRGAEARFSWSVPSDAIVPEGSLIPRPGIVWAPELGPGFTLGPAFGKTGVTFDATTLFVSVPADAGPGPGELWFQPFLSPTFSRCDGVTSCESQPITPAALAVTIGS
jgi:hypothetical protein